MEEAEDSVGDDFNLSLECDEEMDVCSDTTEKMEEGKKEGESEEAATDLSKDAETLSIPQRQVDSCSPSTHASTQSSSQTNTSDGKVKSSSAPFGFKINGKLIALHEESPAELKLCSQPRGSLSGFTNVRIVSKTHRPPPPPPVPEPTPIITGVVSGEAAKKVLNDHSTASKSDPLQTSKQTPPRTPAQTFTPLRTPVPPAKPPQKAEDPPAPQRLDIKSVLGVDYPPDCQACRYSYKYIPELRGFLCLCSPAIDASLRNLKRKRKRRSQPRRSREKPRVPKPVCTPLPTTHSPPQQTRSVSPQDPSQGKLVILVDDFYYGSCPGKPSNESMSESGDCQPFTCSTCQSMLHSNIQFMSHIKPHLKASHLERRKDSVPTCIPCFRQFRSPFRLQCHLETMHSVSESTAKCRICELAFVGEAAFLLHMKSLHKPGEMPYSCQVCGFRSSFYTELWSHFEGFHVNTEHLLCPFCLKVMNAPIAYQQHISQHQRKPMYSCDLCRLHFLHLEEHYAHKVRDHKTHLKPAQLIGLKPGTKVTVRTYSVVRPKVAEGEQQKVLGVEHLFPRQEPRKRKLVQSLGGLLSTLSQESASEDVAHQPPLCVECLSSIQDYRTHFPSLVHCSLCSFVTCCCTSYANHMINNHAVNGNAPQYTNIFLTHPRLSETLRCTLCMFSTSRGDIMANHVTRNPDHQCIMLPDNDHIPLEEPPAPEEAEGNIPTTSAHVVRDESLAPLDEEFEPEELCKESKGRNTKPPNYASRLDQQTIIPKEENEHEPSINEKVQMDQRAVSSASAARAFGESSRMFYHLIDDCGQSHDICNNPLPVPSLSHAGGSSMLSLKAPKEEEGTPNSSVVRLEEIHQHIESFYPTVSHYSRNNSQDLRFLPSDVNVQIMHEDFAADHMCSFKRYLKSVENYKISFLWPGGEPCEICRNYQEHMMVYHGNTQDEAPNCYTCELWEEHKERADKGIRHFKQDSRLECSEGLSIRRVDLQRVVLLPRMLGHKDSLCTKRINAFHETFASVGNRKRTISVVWHEGVALRKAAEVASAFVCAMKREPEVSHIVLWLDGGTFQNKNHCLMSMLATMVNLFSNRLKDITLKYFEPGHSYSRTPSFHQGLEKEMLHQPGSRVLDFEDFKRAVAACQSGKVEVVELKNEDIRAWTDESSRRKVKQAPPLPDVSQIQFRRGSTYMWVKLAHDQGDFLPVDFLRNKTRLVVPEQLRPSEKGIGRTTKMEILRKLCPPMPPQKRVFWETLAENSEDEEDDEDDDEDDEGEED